MQQRPASHRKAGKRQGKPYALFSLGGFQGAWGGVVAGGEVLINFIYNLKNYKSMTQNGQPSRILPTMHFPLNNSVW